MSNDFLAWAVGGSANVESQAAYAADANLPNGYPANAIVPSGTLNKCLRQATFVAASIAQFMADNLAASISDNGSVATFEGNFRSALGYASGTQVWSFTATSFNVLQNLSVSGNLGVTGGTQLNGGGSGIAGLTVANGANSGVYVNSAAANATFYTAIPAATLTAIKYGVVIVFGSSGFNVAGGCWLINVADGFVQTLTALQTGTDISAQLSSSNFQLEQTTGSTDSINCGWLIIPAVATAA